MFECQKYSQGIKLLRIDSSAALKMFVVNRRSGLVWIEGVGLNVWATGPLKTGPIYFPEMSVTTNLRCHTSHKSENLYEAIDRME